MNSRLSFDCILGRLQKKAMLGCLESSAEPLYESQVMKAAFPDEQLSVSDPLKMFQYHFVLFYHLFQLQETYADVGKYLHIHFMRIHLQNYPAAGYCRFYDDQYGQFCSEVTNNNYCEFHRRIVGDTELEVLSEKYFYRDKGNFESLTAETADAFISGAWEVLSRFDDYRNSFRVLGLSEQSSIDKIRKRFYALAKEAHPDVQGNADRFITINNAYHFLMKVMPLKLLK